MSIRLNKALRELNIGLQTAVEFLEKRSELGEVKAEPSFKLSEAQYNALAGAFQQDKEVRSQAEKLLQKKPKEKKKDDTRAERILSSSTQQQYKPLGKIDLDSIGKKPSELKPAAPEARKEPQAKTAAVSQKPANNKNTQGSEATASKTVEKTETKKIQKPVVQDKENKPKVKQEPTTAATKTDAKPAATTEQKPAAETTKTDSTLFTTKSEKKMLNTPKVNVLGKIDLNALNQSTRPKKKSKEEKRKEREEKSQQQRGDKKKRERINKVRVDINAAANQPGGQGGKNTNAGGNGGGSGKNKKKNRGRGQQKPAEVNDEDVARQVKETLARLTSKQSQNKKGAKYRKEKREAAQEKMNEERREERKESKTLKLT